MVLKCSSPLKGSASRHHVMDQFRTKCKEKVYSDRRELAAVRRRLRRCRASLPFLDS
jgi:hypothetical protein